MEAFSPDLTFLHLSDIHFRKGRSGDAHDIDADIRNELERDLRRVRSKRVSKLDGIIVSGDIAFAGLKAEFETATAWIERIRELLDCPKEGVLVTPGNHDVDRTSITDGSPISNLHTGVRGITVLEERDERIAALLRDAANGRLLFSSMKAYVGFAQQYSCEISPKEPHWERDFALGNRGVLRIRGLTSTLISGPNDHVITHKMAYGGAQRTLPRDDNVWRMIVGHHPPSWTLEGTEAEKAFSNRAAIQLFGHTHDQWMAKAGNGVRLIAGAVHPDRREPNWEPRYSLIAIRLEEAGSLAIRIFPRRWSKEEDTFIGDFNSRGHDYRDHVVAADNLAANEGGTHGNAS